MAKSLFPAVMIFRAFDLYSICVIFDGADGDVCEGGSGSSSKRVEGNATRIYRYSPGGYANAQHKFKCGTD